MDSEQHNKKINFQIEEARVRLSFNDEEVALIRHHIILDKEDIILIGQRIIILEKNKN